MGILINTGFDLGSSNPIDNRTLKNTTDERDALISDGLVYENLKVYCKDTQTEYRWTGTEWEEVGTGSSGGTAIDDTQASDTTTYSSNKIADLITEATAGKDFGNLLIVDNASEMSTLATKDNLGKSALYIGDDTYNYTKGEIYELYWDAITIDYLSFAYSPIVKFNFTKIQALLGNRTRLIVTGEYGYQDQADWHITTDTGMDGSRLDNYGIILMQYKAAFGDKFKYTYNKSKKNSYSWLPTGNVPTWNLTKAWYNIERFIMYNGIEGIYKKGRVYRLTGDKVKVSTNSSEISNLAIDKNKFLNNCSLRGDIFFRWYNSGGYFTLLHNGGGDSNRYTKEQFNSWGITYDGDITIDNNYIEIVTSKELSISNWEWKDVTDIDTIEADITDLQEQIDNLDIPENADIIEGKGIDQTVIDTYGTEILKYPLGLWRISEDNIASNFTDLPVKTSGRIEITSINPDTNNNPWDNSWGYRAYNFETYNEMNYFRKLSSGNTAGVRYDTGWQKVCSTIVADVPNTVIVSEDIIVKLNSNCYYTVINGVCYVTL